MPQPTESTAGEAIEWRMTTPDGRQRGPTVPLIFAQWIAAGDVRPDTPVWRTGWKDWRPAGEVADELPAPLVEATADASQSAPAAVASGRKPSRARRRQPATYAERRAQRARVRRRYSVLLAVACVLLTAMLTWLLMTGPPAGAPVLPP